MTDTSLPIGVFDSGLGGLTALDELRKLMPQEDIIYFGDSARIPYGTKSREVISKFALQDAHFLVSKGVKAILVACGTVSSNCLPLLKENFNIPTVGVVSAAAKKACELADKTGKIALLGTSSTIKSRAFEKEISKYGNYEIFSRACPMFVPLVEYGYTSKDDRAANIIANEYLEDIKKFRPDSVILGCTHYPLLSDIISSILPDSALVSSGKEAAKELCSLIKESGLENRNGGKTDFYTSDSGEDFAENAKRFLKTDIDGKVRFADIEKY